MIKPMSIAPALGGRSADFVDRGVYSRVDGCRADDRVRNHRDSDRTTCLGRRVAVYDSVATAETHSG